MTIQVCAWDTTDTPIEEVNRFLAEENLRAHNKIFAINPSGEGEAFVPYAGDHKEILCVQEERVVTGDNTVRDKNRTLQIPADSHRHHDVKARVRAHDYPNGQIAICHGPRKLAQFNAEGEDIKTTQKQAA